MANTQTIHWKVNSNLNEANGKQNTNDARFSVGKTSDDYTNVDDDAADTAV